jgi:hypothetical protein
VETETGFHQNEMEIWPNNTQCIPIYHILR